MTKEVSRSRRAEETDLPRNPEEQRANAELRFRKSQTAAAMRGEAMTEYETEAKAVRAKTAKLKTLRLAKEAEDQAAAERAPVAAKRARKAPAKN